eukprot:CAMPEP_0197247738 /NCGR_PEP_ID=MMETSP1429-20130617/31747_1 /TAXON_ID=49237 /ORGANISM="Chaetoceros  sp., Strain UNC1202" /LENGTH=111 /DNA_ID=CAMNT_0042708733 /DNA_START=174 /DNA_END=509 /DNA_ORIENTATION=-
MSMSARNTQRIVKAALSHNQGTRSIFTTTSKKAMKPGTPIAGLDFLKNVDAAVSKERTEYPDWVNNLGTADKSLAVLKKMDIFHADQTDQMRYLKLTRRLDIKNKNIDAGL